MLYIINGKVLNDLGYEIMCPLEKHMIPVVEKPTIGIRARQIHEDFQVETREGVFHGNAGDVLVREPNGRLYPCKIEDFKVDYDYPEGLIKED